MGVNAHSIRIHYRKVGTMHVFTSPDVPELHVAHTDEETAYKHIQPTLDLIERMRSRIAEREAVDELHR